MSAAEPDYAPPPGYKVEKGYGPKGGPIWHFIAPDGHRGGGCSNLINTLHAADRHLAKSQITERPCMTCRQPFASEGKHNRMCPSCRKETAGLI